MAKMQASAYVEKAPVKRPGIHAKSKMSLNKKSKNYKKKYRGQGR